MILKKNHKKHGSLMHTLIEVLRKKGVPAEIEKIQTDESGILLTEDPQKYIYLEILDDNQIHLCSNYGYYHNEDDWDSNVQDYEELKKEIAYRAIAEESWERKVFYAGNNNCYGCPGETVTLCVRINDSKGTDLEGIGDRIKEFLSLVGKVLIDSREYRAKAEEYGLKNFEFQDLLKRYEPENRIFKNAECYGFSAPMKEVQNKFRDIPFRIWRDRTSLIGLNLKGTDLKEIIGELRPIELEYADFQIIIAINGKDEMAFDAYAFKNFDACLRTLEDRLNKDSEIKLCRHGIFFRRKDFFGVLTPLKDYETEIRQATKRFSESRVSAKRIFEVEDFELNFESINDEQFEQMVYELLLRRNGVIEVLKMGHSRDSDSGRDLIVKEKFITLFGEEERIWIVQCKKQKVKCGIKQFHQTGWQQLVDEFHAHGFWIIISSGFTSDAIDAIRRQRGDKNNLMFWDGKRIESELRKHEDLFAKYDRG
jgi:hypothetical protein